MTAEHHAPTTILQACAYQIGGAGKVMLDLHHEYLRRDLDSWVAVGTIHTAEERVLEIPNEAMRSAWTRALAGAARSGRRSASAGSLAAKALLFASDPRRYLAIMSGVEDFAYPGTRALLGLPPGRPNLLHLHNLHGYYFDLRALPALSRQVPTVITLHDTWLLTGHCAHPFECTRWQAGCGDCPDLGLYVPISKDASARNWQLKRDIVKRSRLGLVSPSHWLAEMVESTLPLGKNLRIRVIPNGVDTSVFRPGDKAAAREALGLPPDATILLASAELLTDNPFKDFRTLSEALQKAAARHSGRLVLVALGEGRAIEAIPGVEVVGVPFVADPERVALYYQAADVYVHAARAENLPLTIIEAMACGTPVVASAVGGIPELVIDGETGSLVQPRDAEALAQAVSALLDEPDRREGFGAAGARRARDEFSLARQADAYLEWYAELAETTPERRITSEALASP